MAKKVLFIGLVWPEPTSSAAGTRILQLVNFFLAKGDEVHFASAAQVGQSSFDLNSIGVKMHQTVLNSSEFDDLLLKIKPDTVVFDRFVSEEQYGWRVQEHCPDALRLLDTEDLHCLRYARQQAIKTGDELNLNNDIALREIAAILRCDLSLIISETELEILENQFHLPPSILHYIPFLEAEITEKDTVNWPTFEERAGFCFIGNFIHQPNWDTVLYLKNEIWPLIRQKSPKAYLHIYGAYMPQKAMQLHNPKQGFLVHGKADDAKTTIAKHRVLLAPIRFGAGAKGKLIDAMQSGTPSITTTIGAESMHGDLPWNGYIADEKDVLVNYALTLHDDQKAWKKAQHNGIELINRRYNGQLIANDFELKIKELEEHLKSHRTKNFLGRLLNHHTALSTKYMSLWIEEKNKEK